MQHNNKPYTLVSQARAQEMWDNKGPDWAWNDFDMTPEERNYILRVWDSLPSHTCFMDAFFRILQGRAPSVD